ncbi:hypothetical protein TKK_0013067 [Trichogramma kaykai]
MRLCTIFLAFLLFRCDAHHRANDLKLELLQVIFRHGDRACNRVEIYKNDPYDEIHRKHGYGELTKVGFQREYQIGRVLRERYDAFLGDYHFDDVYGYSTDLRRTKTSLLLVLAGLYPSTNKTAWNDQLNWIPIPISYSKIKTNFLSAFQCPHLVDMQKEMIRTPEFRARLDEYKEFNEYLATEIGSDIAWKNYLQLLLYNNVRSTMSMGLPMPAWCDSTCYENLSKLSRILFDSLVGNSTMTKFMVGSTIDRLLDNIHESELEDSAKRKIYLYSAHDFNLVTFEEAHNFTEVPVIPDFGSAIVVEKLKDRRGRIYIRMLLWTGAEEQMLPLKIRDCSDPCLLDRYERLVEHIRFRDEYRCESAAAAAETRPKGLKVGAGILRDTDDLSAGGTRRRRRKFDADEQLAVLYAGRDLLEFKYGRECLDDLDYH